MRILIDGRMILPTMTGIGRYLLGLCRGLEKLESDFSFELWLGANLPAGHPANKLGGNRIKLHLVSIPKMSLAGHVRLPFELARQKADLIHYPHFDLPLGMPGPLVSTIHDLKYIARPDFFPHLDLVKRQVIQFLTRYTCYRSRQIICVSQSTADDLHNLLGIPREKLRVVPHGVDDHFFRKRSKDELQDFRIRHHLEEPFLFFVGERRPHKNIPNLIRAFKEFQSLDHSDFQLVIAGKSYADYGAPEHIARELGLDGSVRFLGYVPDAELPYYYQSAAAFVFLSYYEGFGLPVLEAMASGTPVVASDCTSLPEVAGGAGLLVPPDQPGRAAQAILEVAHPGATRDRCIEQGEERARSFTWERCATLTHQVYAEAMEK
jgi:glycosyltransferase involved in cell wall biosynthesis